MSPQLRKPIEELVYRSALHLDEGDFADYLDLCEPDFCYSVSTYSPEIRKELIWLSIDKSTMRNLFDTSSAGAALFRHVTVYLVRVDSAIAATVVSGLQVFRTVGAGTEIYAVGRIFDTVRLGDDAPPRLARRHIKLETRVLDGGTHIPL